MFVDVDTPENTEQFKQLVFLDESTPKKVNAILSANTVASVLGCTRHNARLFIQG